MAIHEPNSKHVCVAMSVKDYELLTRLAQESLRTRPGYMRWLLHQHFEQLRKPKNGDGPS